ncbi:MAG: hypothetical protein ACXABY_25930 [Candidatus Thorarchaeota archaeon]|jgi:hypothetical protein
MFGLFRKSKASTPTNTEKEDKQPNQDKSDWEPGSEFSPAQASLIDSFKDVFLHIEEAVPGWEPRDLSDEEMIAVVQELMRFISMRINTDGEISYVAKQAAKFLAEMLHGSVYKNTKMSNVPPVHATLVDDMYSCIDATKTGLHATANVEAINEEYNKDIKKILRKVQRKAGLNIILPT